MAIPFLLLLFVVSSCVAPMKPASPETVSPTPRKYGSLLESYISCTGNGKIDSRGFFSGELTFKYMSQHDSSFLQFKDILGRKALLMWFTPRNVFAWNLIENKQYDYEQILEFIPFLYIVEPKDIKNSCGGFNRISLSLSQMIHPGFFWICLYSLKQGNWIKFHSP